MFCQKCGAKLNGDEMFCGECGNTVNLRPQVIPQQQAVPHQQAVTQPQVTAQPQAYKQTYQQKPLEYTISGGNLPVVSIILGTGESIYTQSGGMMMMSSNITMTTNMQGGFMKGLGRMFSGESLFMATYTSNAPNQELMISSSFPGSIIDIDISQQHIIAQKSAFLCAQPNVILSAFVTKGIGAGLFGGEGFILQRITGQGRVFWKLMEVLLHGH